MTVIACVSSDVAGHVAQDARSARLLVLGMVVTIPDCMLAGFAPSIEVLFGARLFGGLVAGMAYPTTLALITALWKRPARTKAIALWSAVGGAVAALGSLLSGFLLEHFAWNSVFLVTLPLAGVALPAGVGLVLRQQRAESPLFDLHIAARRILWVAACAGIIVFGTPMAAMFVGQQFLQNVLGYSTLAAGAAMLPAAAAMIVVAPLSARLVESRGARFTLLVGYAFCLLGLVAAPLLWQEDIAIWPVFLAFTLVGIGVGFAGTPAPRQRIR